MAQTQARRCDARLIFRPRCPAGWTSSPQTPGDVAAEGAARFPPARAPASGRGHGRAGGRWVRCRGDDPWTSGARQRAIFAATDIAAIVRDSDGDSWTDSEEQRFGLDRQAPDSDRDGITDGTDVCPALPAAWPRHADHEILATGVFPILGLRRSPRLMLPVPDTPQVHLWGPAGPVSCGRPRFRLTPESDSFSGALFVSWHIVAQAADEATVRVDAATSGTGGEGHRVYLRRIGGRWRVVAVVRTLIS